MCVLLFFLHFCCKLSPHQGMRTAEDVHRQAFPPADDLIDDVVASGILPARSVAVTRAEPAEMQQLHREGASQVLLRPAGLETPSAKIAAAPKNPS